MKSHSRFVIRFTLAMVALFAFGNMVPSAAGATFRWDTISLLSRVAFPRSIRAGRTTPWRPTLRQFRSVATVPSGVELHQPVEARGRRPDLPAQQAVRLA